MRLRPRRSAYQKSKSMVETSLLPCELLRNFMWRCVPAWMVRSSEELKTLRVKAGLLTALDEKELRELRNVSHPSPYTLSPDRSVIGITSEILCMTAILIEIFLVPVYVFLTQRWMGGCGGWCWLPKLPFCRFLRILTAENSSATRAFWASKKGR